MRTVTQAALTVGFIGATAVGTLTSGKAQQTIISSRPSVETIQRSQDRRNGRNNRVYDRQSYENQYYYPNPYQYTVPQGSSGNYSFDPLAFPYDKAKGNVGGP